MTPREFRDLPAGDQVEMMAHRREIMLRKAHSDHVAGIVSKLEDPNEKKK